MRMSRYHYPFVRTYESDPAQHDVSTATFWTLHLGVETEANSAIALTRLENSDFPLLTGEYQEGSWGVWGEEPEDQDDWALRIYFRCHDARLAYETGKFLAALAGLTEHESWVVTCAGDWATATELEEYLRRPSSDTSPDGDSPKDDADWLDVARAVGVVNE